MFYPYAVIFKRRKMGWDRLRVLRKRVRWALHSSYECNLPRPRRQRTTVPLVVWSNGRFSHLFHPLEPWTHYVSTSNSLSFESERGWFFFFFFGDISNNLLFVCTYLYSFYVDDIPIREFEKMENLPFPENQAMRIYSTLWNADDWATQGGRVKTDWSYAPFTASYRNFNADACVWSNGASSCNSNDPSTGWSSKPWVWQRLDDGKRGQMKWVQDNYMIYDYCKDNKRFSQGLAPECTRAK